MTRRPDAPVRPWVRRAALALLVVVLALLLGASWLLPPLATTSPDTTGMRNAVWLGVEWVNEPHSPQELRRLATRLSEHRIGTVFAYTTYLRRDGAFNATSSHARAFLQGVRTANPGLRVEAWIGLPLEPPAWYRREGHVRLDDPAVRARIVRLARHLVTVQGFDGVHVNAEPLLNEDPHFLRLLDELDTSVGRARISVTMASPVPIGRGLPGLRRIAWSDAYLRRVAARTSTVAVMAYDSGMPHHALYEAWMRLQVVNVTRSLAGHAGKVLMGVPTYEEVTVAHRPHVENLRTALRGVRAGLRDRRAAPNVVRGVAVYADWTTSPREWRAFRSSWSDPGGAAVTRRAR